jgi:hypothetical protein
MSKKPATEKTKLFPVVMENTNHSGGIKMILSPGTGYQFETTPIAGKGIRRRV